MGWISICSIRLWRKTGWISEAYPIFPTLRLMRSQNWWFGNPTALRKTGSSPSIGGSWRVQWFLGTCHVLFKNVEKDQSSGDDHTVHSKFRSSLANRRICRLPTRETAETMLPTSRAVDEDEPSPFKREATEQYTRGSPTWPNWFIMYTTYLLNFTRTLCATWQPPVQSSKIDSPFLSREFSRYMFSQGGCETAAGNVKPYSFFTFSMAGPVTVRPRFASKKKTSKEASLNRPIKHVASAPSLRFSGAWVTTVAVFFRKTDPWGSNGPFFIFQIKLPIQISQKNPDLSHHDPSSPLP